MNLPLYIAQITNEEQGVLVMSLVTQGATEVNWQCFKDEKPLQKFAVQNEDEHLLAGVVMTCSTPIYRRDEDGSEYYIMYEAETLKLMAEKMLADKTHNNIDIQHDGQILPEGAVSLVELFVKDSSKGIAPTYFEEVPDGSLLCTYKVHDEALWERCKNGELNSFSLAGYFGVRKAEMTENKRNKILNKMNKLNKIVKSFLVRFAEVTTDKGILSYAGEEDIKVGDEVFVEVEGETKPAEDGDYVLEDGTVIVVAEGKVAEIREPETEEPAVEEAVEDVVEDTTVEEMAEEEPAEEAAEEATEEVAEEVTVDEEKEALKEENEALKAKIEELEAENLALKEQLAEIVNKPAVEPIVEEFEKATEVESTGNKKLDRMIKRFETLKK